jgi:hypothetical protein
MVTLTHEHIEDSAALVGHPEPVAVNGFVSGMWLGHG